MDFFAFTEKDMIAIPMIFIVVGFIMFVIAFLGCCGAIIEQTFMLCCVSNAFLRKIVFSLIETQSSLALFLL